ncbi:putative MFS family arabinose efflux permease [Actinomadura hallensis]|uniref:Putative MFS family arabinose efflux permease n=1 Tax=Actinomadura hallensis TaxID=337895 RepID=A0A543IGU2_9ACTN|nr:MFS transporter [Actinomadura hallensis]TQM69767.1 putative MFS family arabinose efflux permease [Actinomadura hallensis]
MSTSADLPVTERREMRRVLLSSYLGSTVEFYDFLLYGIAASLVFNKLFFANLDPLVGTIASFGTLAAGYVARPLGGIVFGHYGDKVGRKSMLVISMSLMGGASTLVGLLPTYDQIGSLAALLLVALRLVQGIAVGGEWGGAALMALEHADPRRRGFAASVVNMGGPSGAVLATVVFTLFTLLPEKDFLAWGWRVPFLISIVLVAVGLFVRLRVTEPPLFEEARKRRQTTRAPLLEVLQRRRREVVLACFGGSSAFVVQSLLATFALALGMNAGHSRTTVLVMHSVTSILHVVTIPAFAALSDRVGRRPVMMGGALATAVLIYPTLLMISSGSTLLLLAGFLLGNPILQASMYGPLAAYVSEMFGTGSRYTGASLGYQLASTLGAGFAPIIGASLLRAAGGNDPILVAAFAAAVSIVSFLAIWRTRESHRTDLVEVGANPAPVPGTTAV